MNDMVIFGAGQLGYYLSKIYPDAIFASRSKPEWMVNQFFTVDIRRDSQVRRILNEIRPSIIINTAGVSHIVTSYRVLTNTVETNVMGPLHIIDWIKESAPETKFIQCGTASVYESRPKSVHINEDMKDDNYLEYEALTYTMIRDELCSKKSNHPYGKSKILIQEIIEILRKEYKYDMSCALFGNFVSKYSRPPSTVLTFIQYVVELKEYYRQYYAKLYPETLDDELVITEEIFSSARKDLEENFNKLMVRNPSTYMNLMHASDAAKGVESIINSNLAGDWIFAGNIFLSFENFLNRTLELAGIPELGFMWETFVPRIDHKIRIESMATLSSEKAMAEFGWAPIMSLTDILQEFLNV